MLNLAIFYGGKSAEHDISIITAIQVMRACNKEKYKIIPVYIRKDNSWVVPKNYDKINIYTKGKINGTELVTGFYDKKLIKKSSLNFKKHIDVDCAINCCHGLNGEDGTLSGVLELSNIPYVGSSVTASAIGMDKAFMKDIFVANNIPCANYLYFNECDFNNKETFILNEIECKLKYPIIVKPANLGSSIGIKIAKNTEELKENIEIALNFDKKIIVEEVVENLREINCSVIGNYNTIETSLLEEPKNWKEFLDFNEKYLQSDGSKKQIDVHLNEKIDSEIKSLSKKVFRLFGCCGVVRIDFLFDDIEKKIYVNEINTIPGSFANYLWKHKYKFNELIDNLILLSMNEYKYKNSNKYTFQSIVLQNYNNNKSGNKNKL